MPPRIAELPALVHFNDVAGDSRKLDAAFRILWNFSFSCCKPLWCRRRAISPTPSPRRRSLTLAAWTCSRGAPLPYSAPHSSASPGPAAPARL
eukprot:CAMPEP_0195604454 /NCGR_PEP_ID=MMETSP0815-20121206/6651_1 /TAXON_ID=97485 /ORGANISM="Prymnesium parvum, Strain Texoma1" /LENGTH=92 /DNA_ID=CAMNT_0040744111 /DNA_START=106 /DNA_END=381 /DNA_ORIENTATION=+